MEGWNSAIGPALAALPDWATALVADPDRAAWILRGAALLALVGWTRSLVRGRRERSGRDEAAREVGVWRERYEREVLWRRASEAPVLPSR